MKRFIQIHRDDSASDIPNDALKAVLFKLSNDLFGKAISMAIQASPALFHRQIVTELVEDYFENFPDDHVLIEIETDPQQRPISVTTDDPLQSLFTSKPITRIISVPSSSRNINHFVTVVDNEPTSCTCEAFTYRESCKHLEQAKRLV